MRINDISNASVLENKEKNVYITIIENIHSNNLCTVNSILFGYDKTFFKTLGSSYGIFDFIVFYIRIIDDTVTSIMFYHGILSKIF